MLDWMRVEQLRDEVGEDAFAEVVDLFLEEVEAAMAELDPSASPPEIEAQLHALKSAAVNLGFDSFAKLCAEGEAAARGGDTSGIDPARIRQVFDQTQDLFLERLSEEAGPAI